MPDLNKLLQLVVDRKCSDLHLTVGIPPTIRLHGHLRPLNTPPLTPDDTVAFMKAITPERCQTELKEHGSTDFGFAYQNQARFRVGAYQQRGNIGLALRLIPSKLLGIEEIGLPPSIKNLLLRPRGLILVTGPTGSGKTTTLASMINFINDEEDCHIITIEDPIEYYHDHKKSIITQREVGVDIGSFAEAIRRALRMDPDVILVGEMRDLETISLALTAAETGHLVFGTLHTSSAPKTVDRVIDVFPAAQQGQIRTMFAESIQAVVTQTLLRKRAGGRIAAIEVLIGTPAVRNLIRENKIHQIPSSMQTGQAVGMQTLDMALLDLVSKGLVTREEAQSRTNTPNLFGPVVTAVDAKPGQPRFQRPAAGRSA